MIWSIDSRRVPFVRLEDSIVFGATIACVYL